MNTPIYKIKDSVDLFVSDNKYLMVYYMNTRRRKSFKINEWTMHLLEIIDGEKTLDELKKMMQEKFNVAAENTEAVIEQLETNKIITPRCIDDSILSEYDRKRYDRQINYFAEFFSREEEGMLAQKKLMDSKIIIFGCGAVGGDIAIELAMAGVQHITLFDFDKVEVSDASRHMYFKDEMVGYPKIEALAQQIHEIDNRIAIRIIHKSMKPDSNIERLIIEHDFVVNTLDEPYIGYTSSKISRICVKHNTAHYIAGGFDAHLASTGEMIIPYVTPCVECYAGYFKKTLAGWKPKKHPLVKRYREIGGLSSMTLFSASFACIEIIKYLAGLVNMNESFKVRGELLFSTLKLTYINVKKNPDCPICGERGAIK
ncbi:ThiF family adenylyltransferase [Selenomonas ruminantium]|uniref:ThiF family adenylyltransferase n=1 Tax=Selenomonas ruminantium TaxID=971 RepID=UPI0026EBD280|nr:ThiF family adenylyltransferase [Selenomonas ruminantium]